MTAPVVLSELPIGDFRSCEETRDLGSSQRFPKAAAVGCGKDCAPGGHAWRTHRSRQGSLGPRSEALLASRIYGVTVWARTLALCVRTCCVCRNRAAEASQRPVGPACASELKARRTYNRVKAATTPTLPRTVADIKVSLPCRGKSRVCLYGHPG